MVLAIRQTSTLWSEAMHLRPGVHSSNGTMGAVYQRIPGSPLLREHDLHVLAAESVANSAALVLVGISAQSAGP